MALSFYKIIDLTEYADNPDPKVVSQLSIVHEAFDGDLTQYYIDNTSIAEGDKASHALGIRVQDADNTAHYEYTDYDILKWGQPGARITRRRIDRLGVKAFPNIGAIAHYKLANQNLSKIVAPVNYKKEKTKAPTLAAVQNQDGSVTFSITSEIEYMCYRITMQLEFNRLEYVTYEDTYTVYSVPATGEYICWVTGYLAEGAIASIDSNDVILNLTGESPEWPAVLPGAKDKYLVGLDFNEQGFALGTMSDGQTIISTHPAPISGGGGGAAGSTVLIGTDAPAANFGNDGNLYIQYTMSLVGATREWINPNRTALGFTLDWIYNLSDKFEFTYKMNATPSQGGNWPWVLGVANVSTADIVIQFNLWGGRTVMNFGYNGSWAGDGEVSYNSPYDYTNYYTIKGEAGHFTLLRGATLDAINETVFTRNFTDADGDTTLPVKILGVFQSSNTLDMNLYKIDVWDKNDVLIHSYRANTDGLVDLVTNNVIDANVTGYTYGDIDNPGQYMPVFKAMFVKINNIWVPIDTGGSSGSGSIYNIVPAVLSGTAEPNAAAMYEGQQYLQYENTELFTTGLNWNGVGSNSSTSIAGWEFTANAEITIVGLRCVVRNSNVSSVTLRFGTADTILGTISDVAITHINEWVDALFDQPITLQANTNYIVQIVSPSSSSLYYSSNPSSLINTADITYVCGRYGSFPGTQESSTCYSVDVLIGTDSTIETIVASWYKLNGTAQPMQVSEQYSPTININQGSQGITMWRIKYYSHDGTEYLGREYVEDGDNGEWKPSYIRYAFTTTPNDEPVANAQDNITGNINLYVIQLDSFTMLKEDMAETTFCRLSTAIGDGATFNGRYFTRTSNEPVIFVTMHNTSGYRSYGVLSLSSTPPPFTNNGYGQLRLDSTNLISNSTVYLYSMEGMWNSGTPTYTVNGESVTLENDILLNTSGTWSFEMYEEELTEFIVRYIALSQTN